MRVYTSCHLKGNVRKRDKFDVQSSVTFSTDPPYYIVSTTENLQESGLLGVTYFSKIKENGKGLSTASFFCFELLLALIHAALYRGVGAQSV